MAGSAPSLIFSSKNGLLAVYDKRHRASCLDSDIFRRRLIYNTQAWDAVDGTSASLRVIDQPDCARLVPELVLQLQLGLPGELNIHGLMTLLYMYIVIYSFWKLIIYLVKRIINRV